MIGTGRILHSLRRSRRPRAAPPKRVENDCSGVLCLPRSRGALRTRSVPMSTKTHTTTTHYHIQKKRRAEFIDEALRLSGLPTAEAERVRPSIEREVRALTELDARREDVCQHLTLLMDLSRPRVGPFIPDPRWHVVCRMRGLTSVAEHRSAEALLRQFTSGMCCVCEFRSPGPADDKDEELYHPLLERLSGDL